MKKISFFKNQNSANSSQGRSMVEMLGVLAIIGVLSIGGIQGYTLAMRKYRANQILDAANKYATNIYTFCQQQEMDNPDRVYWTTWVQTHVLVNCGNFTASTSLFDDHITLPTFTKMGLGSLPNGLTDIEPHSEWGVIASDNSSSESVKLDLTFQDKELCQTVMSQANVVNAGEGSSKYIHGYFSCGKYVNAGGNGYRNLNGGDDEIGDDSLKLTVWFYMN